MDKKGFVKILYVITGFLFLFSLERNRDREEDRETKKLLTWGISAVNTTTSGSEKKPKKQEK